jgi:hypothetical protein
MVGAMSTKMESQKPKIQQRQGHNRDIPITLGPASLFPKHTSRSSSVNLAVKCISGTRPGFRTWSGPPARPMGLAGQILFPDLSEGGKESWEVEMNRIGLGNDCVEYNCLLYVVWT